MANEQDLNKYLDGLVSEAEGFRDTSAKNWDRNQDLADGKGHWPSEFLKDKNRTAFIFNRIEPLLSRHVGLLTDTRPTTNVFARSTDKEMVATAQALEKTLKGIWLERNYSQALSQQIYMAGIRSTVGTSSVWNPNLDGGRGDIDLVTVPSDSLLVDASINFPEDVQKGEYVVLESVLPLAVIRRRYKRGEFVHPNARLSSFSTPTRGNAVSSLFNRIGRVPFTSSGAERTESEIPKAIVQHFYIQDYRVNEAPEPAEFFGHQVELGGRMFPGGRHIVRSGDVILIDEPNPYWDNMYPVEVFSWDESIWGKSEVDRLESLQVAVNKLGSIILENAIRMSNASWIGDTNALTPKGWNALSNAAGQIIKKFPGTELRRDAPPPLPAHLFTLLQFLTGAMEDLSGLNDVSQGNLPSQGGAMSGVSLETLQLAAQVMVRKRARRLEGYLERTFQHVISRIFQFYTSDRVFRIFGDDDQIKQFVFKRDEIIGKFRGADLRSAFKDFLFTITPGSGLATARIQRGIQALQLFSAGIVDQQDVLEKINWENREAIIERMTQQRSMASFIQSLVAQGLPVPPEVAAVAARSRGPSEQGGRPRTGANLGAGASSGRPTSQPAAVQSRQELNRGPEN